ncbi:16S rRNA m(7)G-527 methyltransferase [Polaromonas naphthalenivorans CJ2]|uniref:Ribosomal RNA small subunit methyltransferase G n=2 Tax=Polaromonas naphthalenivorans TaxID=216465 RepID=RSMG_POLNA|nr:16S rRNA (guanine(527)-N(7))-methyltransferase RsmG [Polaromonas naphthalenivorans]A1VIB2.1 RecName: Full=Ribosomal RNA small subunit methyltransferase G; AltName: Full=16S rRNA 7-methylguanosine methyltransferase; Short=16S rRNA m7G methyltransferase [Polaromonas naphthalenivorans CJ2]ABM35390.1 16S rRNA m(7)G-527 methyltransferase [Polaromonas naphthalenivorans CJ2]
MAATEQNLRSTLKVGLEALQLQLSEQQINQLLAYQAMIAKWTQVYNLTSVRDPAEMMTHHLLDSLAAVPALQRYLHRSGLEQGSRLLDVGSGAGLPGVVIAICCPQVAVTCVDTVAKKAAFIKQAALALRLPNLTGLHARVESITESFDVICSRAFASLADFTKWSAGALAPQGVWMAMKGKHPADELLALPENIAMFHVEQLKVPGLDAERCILWLRPVS